MNALCKSRVHTAVAAALIGFASTTQVVNAQDVSRNNTGQALVFPYYTVNNGWTTTFNAINTSNKTLAVKVRFHESKNSRDVLDFNVVMSPYDAWSGWVQDSDNGPQLFTVDKSCTSPLNVNGATASDIAYTGEFTDTGGAGRNRMREGYIEMLVMGEAISETEIPPIGWDPSEAFALQETMYVPYNAKHVDGTPRNCAAVDAAFVAQVDLWAPETDPVTYVSSGPIPNSLGGSGDPLARIDFQAPTSNPLKGNVSWLHAMTGTGAGSEAIAVEDWSAENYVTAQQFPWFLEPTFASGDGIWTATGVVAFEAAVSAVSTFNEWADNPTNNAATDMVLTFPTKAYHVDAFNDQIQAALSKYRNALTDVVACADPLDRTTCVSSGSEPVPVSPFELLFGVAGTGDSVIPVQYQLFDREEAPVVVETDGTTISPAPPPEISVDALRFEANVVQFGSEAVVDSNNPAMVDASALLRGAPNGWVNVKFTGTDAAAIGLPVAGFVIKERDRGEVATAYGQAMDNGYQAPTSE